MVFWRSGDRHRPDRRLVQLARQDIWLPMVLRDRWMAFDIASPAVLVMIMFKGCATAASNIRAVWLRRRSCSPLLLLPRIVFGSAYADMRLAPFMCWRSG